MMHEWLWLPLLTLLGAEKQAPKTKTLAPVRPRVVRAPMPAPKPAASVTPAAATVPVVRAAAQTTPAPWPAVTPTHLPTFPGPGWEPDVPPPLAVQARALQLISQLHNKLGSYVSEKIEGRWITFVSRRHGSKKAVEAYRLATTKPAPVAARPKPASVAPKSTRKQASSKPVSQTRPVQAPSPVAPQAPTPVSRPTLRFGSRGPDVAELQRRLTTVTIDGIFGPKTDHAVRTYQSANGLTVDGIVGPKTWASLDGVSVIGNFEWDDDDD